MPSMQSFLPRWTNRVVVEGSGRDPLGLSRVSDLFTDRLLPSIITTTDRARYYSIYPWAIRGARRALLARRMAVTGLLAWFMMRSQDWWRSIGAAARTP